MPSPQHDAVVQMLLSRPRPATAPTVQEMRAGFDLMTSLFRVPDGIRSEKLCADGVPGEWIEMPGAVAGRSILYLHGGAYLLGSVNTHRSLVARIAAATKARCLAIDYRLAPEHPFPAAVEDATKAYRWLLARGQDPSRLAIVGDSAGGGLTLATLLALRDARTPRPAAAVCLSPWTDLEGTGASAMDPEIGDPMITVEGLRQSGRDYLGPHGDPRNPLAAPLHGDYRGLPPLLIQVGTREILLDDSTRVAAKAKAAGVDITLERGEGLIHVWHFFGVDVPESIAAIARIGEFVSKHAS
ncbi:MAG TPA: alpha/beta hydrolase [Myxococcota bacterium]|nr:alpha/beta hydrolase [Myxococcota bacterium]